MIDELLPQAERIAARLKARGETISIAESSTAGLISAALLAIAGASAYFMGGAVVYTRQSRTALLEVTEQELTGITPSTEAYALLFARKIRGKLATTWSVGETGTAGPTGSRYGHAAGHSCIAVIGPNGERSITVEPMINAGRYEVKILSDGWTAVTKDRSLSAQFEHTVGVTATGYEIFTISPAGLHRPPYPAGAMPA